MRITSAMMTRTILEDNEQTSSRLFRSLQNVGTGKRLSQPSDDPSAVFQDLLLHRDLSQIQGHVDNVKTAKDFLQATSNSVEQVVVVMQRARELAVQGASDTLSSQDRAALAREVDGLVGELVNIGNTKFGSIYLFGGDKTTNAPFTATGSPVTAVTYQGDGGLRQVEIAPGESETVNIPGSTLFVNGQNLFDTLLQLRSNLQANDGNAISSQIGQFDNAINGIISLQASVGAAQQKLEQQNGVLQQSLLSTQGRLSNIEDTDIAASSIDVQQGETALQAFYAIVGRVASQPTLVNFLA